MRSFLLTAITSFLVLIPSASAQSTVPQSLSNIETDWAHKSNGAEWTALSLSHIEKYGAPLTDTVRSDIQAFCANYPALDTSGRQAFWVGLLSAMTRFESGFDPSVEYNEFTNCKESDCSYMKTRDGRDVISRGLLQLSQESANGYKGCPMPISAENELHDPSMNLRCATAILSRLVSRDGVISRQDGHRWKGGSAYWSVLRPNKLAKVQKFTSSTALCTADASAPVTPISAPAAAQVATPAAPVTPPEISVKTTNLGNGIYELSTDKAGNVGVLIGDDGVFMIDTQMGELTALIDAAQRQLSGRDVELILNTHLHGDHVGGNAYFADKGAVIMAHPNVRNAMLNPVKSKLTGGQPAPYPKNALPSVNVQAGDSVTMNGQTARFYHAPNAHTNSDIFVMFEDANVIHSGDLLFANRFPYIDLDNGGSVTGYIAGMQAIVDLAKMDTKIIAGHGPLSTEKTLESSIKMLKETRTIIKTLVEKGMNLQAIQATNPLADYHEAWNWGFISTERMVWTLYRDLTGKIE